MVCRCLEPQQLLFLLANRTMGLLTKYCSILYKARAPGQGALRFLLLLALMLWAEGCRIEVTESPGIMSATATSARPSTLPIQLRWCISDTTSLSNPIYSKGLVFVVAGSPEISANPLTKTPFSYRAYDADNGALVWEKQMEDRTALEGTPGYWAAYEDWLTLGSLSGLMSIEAKTGKVLWSIGGVFRGLAVGDHKVFVVTDETLDAYDVVTGTRLWRSTGPTRNTGERPLYDAESNLLVGNYVNYYVWDSDTGAIIHQSSSLAVVPDTYLVNTGQIYKGKVFYGNRIFDASTGGLIHTRKFAKWQASIPFAIDNKVFLNGYTEMVAEDTESYLVLWRYQPSTNGGDSIGIIGDPVALNDVVYVMLSDATIQALDLATGQEIGSWQGSEVIDRRDHLTPFIPDLEVGDGMLFASFGTNQLCAFRKPE